jgi:hypothetical protein
VARNDDEPIAAPHRQRSKNYRIHNAEDGGVGANAQRECDDDRDRESRMFEQHPQAVANVPEEGHV